MLPGAGEPIRGNKISLMIVGYYEWPFLLGPYLGHNKLLFRGRFLSFLHAHAFFRCEATSTDDIVRLSVTYSDVPQYFVFHPLFSICIWDFLQNIF